MNTSLPSNKSCARHHLVAFLVAVCAACSGCRPENEPSEKPAAVAKILDEIGAPAAALVPEVASADASLPSNSESNGNRKKQSGAPQSDRVPELPSQKTEDSYDPTKPWVSLDQLPRETWEIQYSGNTPVGYFHRIVDVSKTMGNQVLRVELESRVRVNKNGKPVEQKLNFFTFEKDNGELISFDGTMESGSEKQLFQGSVSNGKLRIKTIVDGKTTDSELEWKPEYRGPFAVDQAMVRKPLQPNEVRSLKYLDPIQMKLVSGIIEAGDYINTPVFSGETAELLEVRNRSSSGDMGLQTLLWVDKKGETNKTYYREMDLRSFRCDPSSARVLNTQAELNSVEIAKLPLFGPTDELEQSERTVFRITHRKNDPFKMFSSRSTQRVRSLDARAVEVTVIASNQEQETVAGKAFDSAANPEYLAPSRFIQSDSPQIQKLAELLLAEEKLSPDDDAKARVKAFHSGLSKRLPLKAFDKLVSPTGDIIRSTEANCLEHAIVLTALCRSNGIPSRIASGLRYNASQTAPALVYHSWVEFHDGSTWLPVDSTEKNFEVAANRIKLSETAFATLNPYEAAYEVYLAMYNLDVSVLSH